MKHLALLLLTLLLLNACAPQVPDHAQSAGRKPQLTPDYTDVTLPVNLCPPNFIVAEAGQEVLARLSIDDEQYVVRGHDHKVQLDAHRWHQLATRAAGRELCVEVWVEGSEGWTAFTPFSIRIAPEPIDPWISYRLIPPSYVAYEEIIIAQRDLTSFNEEVIYNTMLLNTETKGQCINCHSYQNYRTHNMLFHIRKDYGGTMLVRDGKVSKVDLKVPETLSAGVYPAWHPTEPLIAFSTNLTAQTFHNQDTAKIEVFDGASDLILYDAEHNQVSHISNLEEEMEVFPTWSPDGQWLYFCSARPPYDTAPLDSLGQPRDLKDLAMSHYDQIRYDLYRMPFDPATHHFGQRELIYEASADSMSVTLPRFSPDGQWLLFARGSYGCFHVWHPDADIWLLPIAPGHTAQSADSLQFQPRPLAGINSAWSESYPTFSSNGHWVMTASRRDDNNYTRPYIAYFHPDGTCDKPFELPQRDPEFYSLSFKSYNRPEFMVEPVSIDPREFARVSKDGVTLHAQFKTE